MLKVAEVAPAGIVTLSGTMARVVFDENIETEVLFGITVSRITFAVVMLPVMTLSDANSILIVGLTTVVTQVGEVENGGGAIAEMVAVPAPVPVTGNVADVDPEGIVTLTGTAAIPGDAVSANVVGVA